MSRLRTAALAVALTLALATCAGAQTVGAAIGGYHRPSGHPHIHFAGYLRAEWSGVGVEFMHAATRANPRPLDLFTYRATYRQSFGSGTTRPFLVGGVGYGLWREWICQNGSCGLGAESIDADKFAFHRGASATFGAGIVSGPLRLDARTDWTPYGGVDAVLSFGAELEL